MARRGEEEEEEEEKEGILLYYKYTRVPDVSQLLRFFESNCNSLGLLGRVRLAPDGVNATVGGKLSALEEHISALKSNTLFEGTDFKLACCGSPSDDRVAKECGFTSLSIRVVKELVTFSSHPFLKSPSISNAGRHLLAKEFHSVLQNDGKSLDCIQDKRLLLLDARNIYETRIGKFQITGVETLDPEIRQYSDLPAWIDDHSEELRGSSLFGGIQRYLEQFPDGGFFKGKNFVFDHRISVGSSNTDVLGSCLVCSSSFDDYSSRHRCTHCRMLVLVCDSCQGEGSRAYVCELCQKHAKGAGMLLTEDGKLDLKSKRDRYKDPELESASSVDRVAFSPELRCRNGKVQVVHQLCHFEGVNQVGVGHLFAIGWRPGESMDPTNANRENASNFKGRTASLAKKLKNIAELVYVDAPHELPLIYQPRPPKLNHQVEKSSSMQQIDEVSMTSQQHTPAPGNCRKRFAWLVADKFSCPSEKDWKLAHEPFDPLQYQQQTEGLEESYAYLKAVCSKMGPFDGILGFSQGAAMAALFCALQGRDDHALCFRFAILCSGFRISSEKIIWGSSINCPSLHIFGGREGKDRQIARSVSMELAQLFDEGSADVLEHESGHIIPTQPPYIDQTRDFLMRFCRIC
ncbi:hypothetical protein ACLOJK_026609 [Asimina triloba]